MNLVINVDIFNKNNDYIVLKRLISILLVIMLIFNSAGYIIVFYQLKKYIKKEALSKLENYINPEDLTTIVISKHQFENEDDNFFFVEPHEIKYFGKMYDIARIEHTADSVRIHALSDENEDNLHELFAQFISRSLNDKYSKAASVINKIINDAGLPVNITFNAFWRENVFFIFVFLTDLSDYNDLIDPPPKSLI